MSLTVTAAFPTRPHSPAHTPLLTRQHFQYFSTPVSALFYCRLRRANSEHTTGRMLSFIETSSILQMGLLPLNSASLEILEHGQSSQILGRIPHTGCSPVPQRVLDLMSQALLSFPPLSGLLNSYQKALFTWRILGPL